MRVGSWVERAHMHVDYVSKAILLKDLIQCRPILSTRGSERNRHSVYLDSLSIEPSRHGQETNESNAHH